MAKKERSKRLEGIGGWLILFIIYLLILIIRQPIEVVRFFINDYNHLPNWIVNYSLVNNALLAIGTLLMIISLIFIFMKSKKAIKFNIFLFSFLAIVVLVENIWYFVLVPLEISKNLFSLIFNLIIDGLVISYFLKSKRVKNTLVK
ncbi:MAG: DUF2569 family protein [Nanoarchaeota archaeon]|nr:DUF2569 family protein [Nanoarchaeota archaeon]